jgi:hypothetical protein
MDQAYDGAEGRPQAVGGGDEIPWWRHVKDALRELRFGTVTLTVQDGVVVQVERTEKLRFPRRARQ